MLAKTSSFFFNRICLLVWWKHKDRAVVQDPEGISIVHIANAYYLAKSTKKSMFPWAPFSNFRKKLPSFLLSLGTQRIFAGFPTRENLWTLVLPSQDEICEKSRSTPINYRFHKEKKRKSLGKHRDILSLPSAQNSLLPLHIKSANCFLQEMFDSFLLTS